MVSNGSRSVVNRANWYFAAFMPSTDLVEYGADNADTILNPNTWIVLCFGVPKLRENADPATVE